MAASRRRTSPPPRHLVTMQPRLRGARRCRRAAAAAVRLTGTKDLAADRVRGDVVVKPPVHASGGSAGGCTGSAPTDAPTAVKGRRSGVGRRVPRYDGHDSSEQHRAGVGARLGAGAEADRRAGVPAAVFVRTPTRPGRRKKSLTFLHMRRESMRDMQSGASDGAALSDRARTRGPRQLTVRRVPRSASR